MLTSYLLGRRVQAIVAWLALCLCTHASLCADEPSDVEPGVFSGTVLDSDGEPVSNAQVLLRGRSLERTTTDKDGRFRFNDVAPSFYRVWARTDDHISALASFRVQLKKGEAKPSIKPVELKLAPGKRLRWRVTSKATGEPIKGATVKLGYPFRENKQTDANGLAEAFPLMDQSYEITVEAAGHAFDRSDINLEKSKDDSMIDVALDAGGVVKGVVKDANGKPINRARVSFRVDRSPYGFNGTSPYTDDKGRFQHNHLPLGATITVSASMTDMLPQKREVSLASDNRTQTVEFKLEPRPFGGSVAGIVKDHKGKTLAGVEVENWGRSSSQKRTAKTDKAGKFLMHDLLKSYVGHEIVVRPPGYEPIRKTVEPGTKDKPTFVEVVLHPGHTVRGQVVDESGKPIKGARVSYNNGRMMARLGGSTTTDSMGKFELDSLPAKCEFDIRAAGYSQVSDLEIPLDQPTFAKVTLAPMGIVRGRVVDAKTGKPIPRFNVKIGFSPVRKPGDKSGSYSSRLADPGTGFDTPKGVFRLENLTNGMPLAITVEADGYLPTSVPRVMVLTTFEADMNKFELKRLDPSQLLTFRGRIVDHAGQPVVGANLRLMASKEKPKGPNDNRFNWVLIKSGQLKGRTWCDQFLSAVSDRSGNFSFKEVRPGMHLQLVYWGSKVIQGRTMLPNPTQAGKDVELTVKQTQPVRITGTIDRAKLPKAGSISVRHVSESWFDYEIKLTKDQTKFELDFLPPGKLTVVVVSLPVRSPDNDGSYRLSAIAQEEFDLKPGEEKSVHFGKDEN